MLLEVISSEHKINTEKYSKYATDTAEMYVRLYPWHPLTPTMHKILIHGAIVIENALLPIGQLPEEAAEARNKYFHLYRQNFARKFSRVSCNLVVLNRLLLSSDQYEACTMKKTQPFLTETVDMLLRAVPHINPDTEDSHDDESSEELQVSCDDETWQ